MENKKITIIQILIILMIIAIVSIAIILLVSSNDAKESKVDKSNIQNEIKDENYSKVAVESEEYIPNASDEDKIQRGFELFGDEKCSLSVYVVKKLKEGEWNQGSDYEDNVHNKISDQDNIQDYYCTICGELILHGPGGLCYELCDKCTKITNRCRYCGKLKLNEEENKLSLQEFQNKEYILKATRDYIRSGENATHSLFITEDYYIYEYLSYMRIEFL